MRFTRLAFLVVAGSLLYAAVVSGQALCSAPSRRLTGTDYALLGMSTTLLATDWLTSVDAIRNGCNGSSL